MKKNLLTIVLLLAAVTTFSQVKLPQARMLETRGWSVQHSVMSWDSLSVYFSAKAPGATNYDLYVMHPDGWRWGEPQRIDALSTEADELWPSVSSDERMIFYAVTDAQQTVSQIWRAWQRNHAWTEAAPIIVSGTEDSQPTILEDNCTLLFTRKEQTKKNESVWRPYSVSMMDDHNWTLPQPAQTAPAAKPILATNGTIVIQNSKRPLGKGQVLVYDATNEQLLQTAKVHPMTGHWRVALQANRHYRLALMAEGYSYHYIDIVTNGLSAREERAYGTIALDDRLALKLNSYDAETQEILDSRNETLALGKIYSLSLKHTGYDDAILEVNTARPMVFTETELDIPLQPRKSLHHFRVVHALNGEPVQDVQLRLNGQPSALDTTLRIGQQHTLQISAPGYLFRDTLFDTGTDTRERTIQVALRPLSKDLVLQLRNIQFEYDSYQLTENSNAELESLAQLLFMNPTLRIELSSHTDDQGSDKYNDRLSTLRGKAVEEWLTKRGVDPKRMEAVGYGKRKPLVANDSEAHRALNRRVEIKVLDF